GKNESRWKEACHFPDRRVYYGTRGEEGTRADGVWLPQGAAKCFIANPEPWFHSRQLDGNHGIAIACSLAIVLCFLCSRARYFFGSKSAEYCVPSFVAPSSLSIRRPPSSSRVPPIPPCAFSTLSLPSARVNLPCPCMMPIVRTLLNWYEPSL